MCGDDVCKCRSRGDGQFGELLSDDGLGGDPLKAGALEAADPSSEREALQVRRLSEAERLGESVDRLGTGPLGCRICSHSARGISVLPTRMFPNAASQSSDAAPPGRAEMSASER